MSQGFDIWYSLDLLPGIILGLTVHEAAHAWAAWKLGDPTAKEQGRLSLDPAKHLDPLGLLVLFLTGMGWAKPVEFNPDNLGNPRRDKRLIALAGPLANMALAIVLSLVYTVIKHRFPWSASSFDASLMRMLLLAVLTNWMLGIFNLIPLPPLDGSHVAFPAWTNNMERAKVLARWGGILLFALIIIQNRANVSILPVDKLAIWLCQGLFGMLGMKIQF